MKNLTTNERIMYQLCFKEACAFYRCGEEILQRLSNPSLDSQLKENTKILYETLKGGLRDLSEDKNSTVEQHIEALRKLSTVEEYIEYQNEHFLTLKNISKTDKAQIKSFCTEHFNTKDS